MVSFESPGSIIAVCTFCDTASWRRDVDLELIGKVAERTPLASFFQIGTSGRHDGHPFVVRGQLQMDHGIGVWNEWCAETDEGEWLWIAEAQGQILVLQEAPVPESLSGDLKLDPGRWLDLGEYGHYVVSEVGRGKVVTVAGELPIRLELGKTTDYVDLAQGSSRVATLDWTRDKVELLLGRIVEISHLELDPSTQPEHRPDRVKARDISCSHCGAAIVLRDPENTRRVACESCDTLLDASSEHLVALEAEVRRRTKPGLPLGASGKIRGLDVQIIGFMVRSVTAVGENFPWREYLLKVSDGGYRWLVESDGHWLFIEPINPGAIASLGFDLHHTGTTGFKSWSVLHRDQKLSHFTSGNAAVDVVYGEFYWDVQIGETALTRDFVAPPLTVSMELSPSELSVSKGHHLTRRQLRRAFKQLPPLRAPQGVGMAQPNPFSPISRWWMLCGLAIALLLFARVIVGLHHEDLPVLTENFGPVPRSPVAARGVHLTEPFDLYADPGNLQVRLDVPGLTNGWVGVDGSLINLSTGDVTSFGISCGFYKGRSGGENWKEGSRRGRSWIGSIPAGQYRLRLASSGDQHGIGRTFQISVRSQVPREKRLIILGALIILIPGIVSLFCLVFEGNRWKNSDHPWSSES